MLSGVRQEIRATGTILEHRECGQVCLVLHMSAESIWTHTFGHTCVVTHLCPVRDGGATWDPFALVVGELAPGLIASQSKCPGRERESLKQKWVLLGWVQDTG